MIWQTRNIPIFLVVILSSDGQRDKTLVPPLAPVSVLNQIPSMGAHQYTLSIG